MVLLKKKRKKEEAEFWILRSFIKRTFILGQNNQAPINILQFFPQFFPHFDASQQNTTFTSFSSTKTQREWEKTQKINGKNKKRKRKDLLCCHSTQKLKKRKKKKKKRKELNWYVYLVVDVVVLGFTLFRQWHLGNSW